MNSNKAYKKPSWHFRENSLAKVCVSSSNSFDTNGQKCLHRYLVSKNSNRMPFSAQTATYSTVMQNMKNNKRCRSSECVYRTAQIWQID